MIIADGNAIRTVLDDDLTLNTDNDRTTTMHEDTNRDGELTNNDTDDDGKLDHLDPDDRFTLLSNMNCDGVANVVTSIFIMKWNMGIANAFCPNVELTPR